MNQEIKYEEYFCSESNCYFCGCGSFRKEILLQTLLTFKYFQKNARIFKSSEDIVDQLDTGINQLTKIVDTELRRQWQNHSLVE